ncbi:FecCD family ABC transporter permease [Methanococcus maripaludis]|uniref:Putative iron compound ABC transporter permease protein n=1 Tax=Methanococcus maripaludis OS7 TaxID=637915 RepID=A0A2Z5PFM1_METMI|nr:iron ABC transporter permease [Methanococcus maripaludis]BAP62609.1 putative iron compound ABC transporter permease protein [Methanococcus maripaludis OS7]
MKYKIFLISIIFLLDLGLVFAGIYYGGNAKSIDCGDITNYIFEQTTGDELKDMILQNVRIPPIFAAIFVGLSLSVCGLMLQTLFRNFLASPYTTGITSGVLLFASFVIFLKSFSELFAAFGPDKLLIGGWIGGLISIIILVIIASKIKDVNDIIVVSLLMSYFLGGIRAYLVANADPASVMTYYFFALGSITGIRPEDLPIIGTCSLLFALCAFLSIKPLNALLFGESYAKSFGLSVKKIRILILASTAFVAGSIMPYVGSINFVGVAAPFIARPLIKTSDHRWLVPTTLLTGIFLMLVCHFITFKYNLPFSYLLGIDRPVSVIPIGSVLDIVGGLLVIYLVVSREKKIKI